MKQIIVKHKTVAILFFCLLLGIITMSFKDYPFGPLQHYDSLTAIPDSIPADKNNEHTMSAKEYDAMMQEITTGLKEITASLKDFNASTINQELNKVDWKEVTASIDKALKEVDMSSIEKDIKMAMKEIDWDKMNKEVKASLEEAKKELQKIDMKEVKAELEKAKAEIEKSRNEIEKIDFSNLSEEIKKELTNAKEALQKKKEMFTELEKDGLIKKDQRTKIEYKKEMLYINGIKQPEAVQNKYRQYFTGDESYDLSL